ncbi:MAG: HD domain-containing protein [Thermoanaerobacterales bacterium]|nr:HD domain-containing protein [Thermoanaerobacterales bacterium]
MDPSRPPPVPDDPAAGATDRLAAQVGFVLEADRLKSVLRRGHLADGSRLENSAEHSWTLALMAIVLAEHAAEPVDLATVLRMVVVHDIVEVDAGDTYVYDDAANSDRAEREERAADRIFGLLPPDQAAELRALWDEFEHGSSPEARFARSLDRFAGFLLNHASGGRSWRDNGVTADMIHARNERIGDGAPALWDEVRRRLADAVAEGLVDPGPRDGGGS